MKRFVLPLALAALAASVPAAAAAEPRLEGRAILPADATAPAPFAGAPNLEPAPAPGARQPVGGFSALSTRPDAEPTGPCPTTASAPRPTRARSSCACTACARTSRPPTAARRRGDPRLDHAARPRPQRAVRDRHRGQRRPPADRRRLRRRVRPRGRARRPLVRRGVRPVPAPHRRHREGARGADPAAGRQVARATRPTIPLPSRARPTSPTPTASRAWRCPTTTAGSTRCSKGPSPATTRAAGASTSSISTPRAYTGRAWRYEVADPAYLVSDFTALDRTRFVSLERDNGQGVSARHKRGFVVELPLAEPGATAAKREVVDLLDLRDPVADLVARAPGRHRARRSVRDALPDDRGRAAARRRAARHRQRHELRVHRPQPGTARRQRIHHRPRPRPANPLTCAGPPAEPAGRPSGCARIPPTGSRFTGGREPPIKPSR